MFSPVLLTFLLFSISHIFRKKIQGHNRIRTNDRGNCSPTLYHWAMRPFLDLFFSVFCSFPVSSFPCPFPYSLVPIFFPFFLSSSAVSTFFFLLSWLTTWPSGLRRVTRNHFSSGGVGSNPAVVVFSTFISFSFFYKKMVLPRFELGSREPESHMLPLHHGTLHLC